MARGGHNWKGRGTVEGARPLDVMKVARAGYLSGLRVGGWQWTRQDRTTAFIGITGGRQAITLDYESSRAARIGSRSPACADPLDVLRFGGERPWFVCDVFANGAHCGRQVAKLYGAGRLFACRNCYGLGYAVQRGGVMDRAHHRLARLQWRLGADYDGPDGPPPPRPKWMRQCTYQRIVHRS